MIENYGKTADYISNWIGDYARKAGIRTLVLGLSGGIDSALVALLCKRTGMPLLNINMPCHSSDTAYNRAKAFADDYGLKLLKVDITGAHDIIYHQAVRGDETFKVEGDVKNPIAVGGLRSCLRAPTLNFFTNAYKGIIVGTGNRSEDNITRYFQKFGDGCVDIAPIADLFKSEVRELFGYLATEMLPAQVDHSVYIRTRQYDVGEPKLLAHLSFQMSPGAQAIYDAKPTADLWGPDSGQEDEKELGISYDEIEWADREDMRTQVFDKIDWMTLKEPGIIKRDEDPAKYKEWYKYSARQKEVIAKLHQLEKISRHKMNPNLPTCLVRSVPGLVK
jgi:NAD+ synthase